MMVYFYLKCFFKAANKCFLYSFIVIIYIRKSRVRAKVEILSSAAKEAVYKLLLAQVQGAHKCGNYGAAEREFYARNACKIYLVNATFAVK